MRYDRPNDPNASRLVESLRHLGYGNYEAIADIVDNSIDAEAPKISIKIQQKGGQPIITIADDGQGMTEPVLDQAMRLGSLTSRDLNSDLGKFGMGLVTASLSLARQCHVITRTSEGTFSSAWDVDEIVSQNKFVKHLDKANDEECARLKDEIGTAKGGTLVTLSKCDNLGNKNLSSFASNLKHHLGRVHRYFIAAGREIRSLKAQGFSVMRNQREVMNAVSLNFFTKHNDFNRMRGELFFPAALDGMVGIEFTKRQVDFEQSLFDQLAAVLVPTCRTIKHREATKKRIHSGEAQVQLHNQAAKVIAEKDKLLIKPKAVIEKRMPARVPGSRNVRDETTTHERRNFTRTQEIETRLNCQIREERMGPNGQIYECDMEGRKLILRYNIEHPFYQRFVVDNLSDSRAVTAADFLIYSMASAELKMMDDGELEAVNNFKAVLSANLRTLLN
ncbi:MAG: ATP-binding protein [Acidobacteriia bacterium]|nr:ATP-binding protein [Terriglobia bacterium]